MNIDKLTFGQIKEITSLMNGPVATNPSIFDGIIGKYVIVRSRNEGVNCGIVVEADETGIVLSDARRLYYHKPLNKNISWYEGVAVSGLGEGSKVGPEVKKIIVEDYSITFCTGEAEKSLRAAVSNAQN